MPAIRLAIQEHPIKVLYNLLKIDALLFSALVLLSLSGLMVLYSASGGDIVTIQRQCLRLLLGFAGLLVFAQIPVDNLRNWSPWLYAGGVILLLSLIHI